MALSPNTEWMKVCGTGAVLYYNDPITRTWKPVCGAADPVYGLVNGEWVPLCCQGGSTPTPSAQWSVGGMEITGISTASINPVGGEYYTQPQFHAVCLVSETLGVVFFNQAPFSDYTYLTAQVFTIVGGVPTLVGPRHALWGLHYQNVIRCVTRVDSTHVAFIGECWSGPDPALPTFAQVLQIASDGSMTSTAYSALPSVRSGGSGFSLSGGRMMYVACPVSGYSYDPLHVQAITVTATASSLSFSDGTFARSSAVSGTDFLNPTGDGRTKVMIGGSTSNLSGGVFRWRTGNGVVLTVSDTGTTMRTLPASAPDTTYGYFFNDTFGYMGSTTVSPAAGVFLGWAWPNTNYGLSYPGTLRAIGVDGQLGNARVLKSIDNYVYSTTGLTGHDIQEMAIVAVDGHADVLTIVGGGGPGCQTITLGTNSVTTAKHWNAIWTSRAQYGNVGVAIINQAPPTDMDWVEHDFNFLIAYRGV